MKNKEKNIAAKLVQKGRVVGIPAVTADSGNDKKNDKKKKSEIPPGKQQPPVKEPPGTDNPNIPPGHSEPVPVKEPVNPRRKKIERKSKFDSI